MKLVDAHCHFGPGLKRGHPFGPLREYNSATDLIDQLAAVGINQAVVFAPRWQGGDFIDPDYSRANAAIAEAVKQHPSRLVGFVRVNPKFGQQAAAQVEAAAEQGFQGLKLDPETESFSPLDLKLLGPLLEICQAKRLPVLVHTSFHPAQPLLWLEAAQAFPQVNFILGHMGYRVASDAVIAAQRADNIFLEISGQQPSNLAKVTKSFDPLRIIFGTDAPFNDPRTEVERLRKLNLPEDKLAAIGRNSIMQLLPGGWQA